MPKKPFLEWGLVKAREREDGRWVATWTDPLTRKYIRRVLTAADRKEALDTAKTINAELTVGRGFSKKLRGVTGHTINEASQEAIRRRDADLRTRQEYAKRFNQFLQWIEVEMPGVQGWGDVTEAVAQGYADYCRRSGIAFDTMRQRIHALKLVSRYMCETYPDLYPRDVARVIRLKRPQVEDDGGGEVLTPNSLRSLLAWLREHEPMMHCWAVLSGLTGLRQREAVYLRRCDVDLKAGTIRIAARPVHGLKNQHSVRTLPVGETVRLALANWIEQMTVQHLRQGEDYLFLNAVGRPFGMDYASRVLSDSLTRAQGASIKLPDDFISRRLRATFVTAMRGAGADLGELQAYCGHRQGTILGAHYDKITLDRLRKIADLADDMAHLRGVFAPRKTTTKSAGSNTRR